MNLNVKNFSYLPNLLIFYGSLNQNFLGSMNGPIEIVDFNSVSLLHNIIYIVIIFLQVSQGFMIMT